VPPDERNAGDVDRRSPIAILCVPHRVATVFDFGLRTSAAA